MGKLYVVRHADAGTAGQGDGPDRLRGLSDRGRRQADGLRARLAGANLGRLSASPFVRCIDTLRPLSDQLGIPVDADERLREGTGAAGVLELAHELRDETAAVCSHGDVIPDLLEELVRRGVTVEDDLRWPKASVWVLTRAAHGFLRATYLAPPC